MIAPACDPRIVRATTVDAAVVAGLYLEARSASAMPPGIHPPAEVLAHVEDVVLVTHEVWLAVLDDRPVGLLTLDGAELNWLFVAPDVRGRGIGAALLAHAKRRRPDALGLWVFTVNGAAQRFYRRHGFVVVGGTDGDNEEGEPDVRMEWRAPRTGAPAGDGSAAGR